jgi:hypothetical protein
MEKFKAWVRRNRVLSAISSAGLIWIGASELWGTVDSRPLLTAIRDGWKAMALVGTPAWAQAIHPPQIGWLDALRLVAALVGVVGIVTVVVLVWTDPARRSAGAPPVPLPFRGSVDSTAPTASPLDRLVLPQSAPEETKAAPPARPSTTKFGPRVSGHSPRAAPIASPEGLYAELVADGVERTIATHIRERTGTPDGRHDLIHELLSFVDNADLSPTKHPGSLGLLEYRCSLYYHAKYAIIKPFLTDGVRGKVENTSITPVTLGVSPEELRRLIRRDIATVADLWGVTL